MEKVIDFQNHHVVLEHFADAVEMPDGSKRTIRMAPQHWNELKFLEVVEGMKQRELSLFALEEWLERDDVPTFDLGFQIVVHHLASRWS